MTPAADNWNRPPKTKPGKDRLRAQKGQNLTHRRLQSLLCCRNESRSFSIKPVPYRGNTKTRSTANIPKQRAPHIYGKSTRNSGLRFGNRREIATPISSPTTLEPKNIRVTKSSPAIPSPSPPKQKSPKRTYDPEPSRSQDARPPPARRTRALQPCRAQVPSPSD